MISNRLKQTIEDAISKYINLPLECDGLTRVLSHVLKKERIFHKCKLGIVSYQGNEILHYWIELRENVYLDYRLQMWLGESEEIPHGIFDPTITKLEYSQFENIDLSISAIEFLFLTEEEYFFPNRKN